MTETIKTDNTQALYNALDRIAELEKALQGMCNWSHWANEKLFGDVTSEPLFPEYKKAKQILNKGKE
jgi:hypothetical protein